jgi:hypothetical protein
MTFLIFFLGFLGLLAVLHGVFDSNFKLCSFVVNGLIKGEIEKPSGRVDCDESLTWQCLNSNPEQVPFVFLVPLFHLENCVCLSRDVQVAGAAWRAMMRTMAGVGDLAQRTEDGRTGRVLGGRAVERSGGVVCSLHLAHGD